MQSTSTRTIFLQTTIVLALGAGLTLLAPVSRAQSTDADAGPGATAVAATNAAAALDLGDCPDNADGLGQGKAFTCSCPAVADPAPIYGTDVYTPDSALCTAAVHAGALPQGAAGSVSFQMVASPPVFKGTTRNGIKSEIWPQQDDAAIQFAPVK